MIKHTVLNYYRDIMYHPVNDANPPTHNFLQVTTEINGNNKTWNLLQESQLQNKHLLYYYSNLFSQPKV